jgi:hypothetical protein
VTQPPTTYPPTGYPPPGRSQPSQGLAVAALVCGILSILLFCAWKFALLLAVAAIALGVTARKKVREGTAGGDGLAKAGIITGIIGLVIALVIAALAIFVAPKVGAWGEAKMKEVQQEMEKQAREHPQTTMPTTRGSRGSRATTRPAIGD